MAEAGHQPPGALGGRVMSAGVTPGCGGGTGVSWPDIRHLSDLGREFPRTSSALTSCVHWPLKWPINGQYCILSANQRSHSVSHVPSNLPWYIPFALPSWRFRCQWLCLRLNKNEDEDICMCAEATVGGSAVIRCCEGKWRRCWLWFESSWHHGKQEISEWIIVYIHFLFVSVLWEKIRYFVSASDN